MKKTAIIKSIKQANDIKDLVSAFIVPLKDYSINYQNTFDLEDIKELQKLNKEIFISMNKNIYNNELENLKQTLLDVDKLNIEGIIFYDISIVKLKKELNIKTDLVWSQEHLVTNYGTINYWYDKGVNYAYLSSELSKEEILEIKENSKVKLFINVFGYIPMFTSRRNIVKNYLEYFNLEDKNKNKAIYKEGKSYPINDEKHGTTVYSNYILNILDENFLDNMYIVYNSLFIEENDFKDILKQNDKFPYEYGFLYKNIIYKVKNNE